MKIESKFKTLFSFIVWGVSDLYFILSVTVAILLGILLPSIQKELGLNTTQLGLLGFAFFLSFGVMQFITGSLIDLKGPKIALVLSALTASGGLFFLSYVEHFREAIIAQMIIGVGFSIAYVGAIYLAEMWFSKELFPFFSGLTQMSANCVSALVLFSMALGGAISIDFRELAIRLGLASFFLAFLLFFTVRKAEGGAQPLKRSLFGADFIQLFRIPQFWYGVFYFATNFGVFLAFSSLWNIPDSIAYGHSLKTATMMSATLRFGGAFGSLISGAIAHRIGKCSSVAKWYSTGALFTIALLIYGPVFPVEVTFLIMGFLGFFFGATALGFPLIAQNIPASLKGAGFGFMTSFGYLLCAFLEGIIGVFLSHISLQNLPITVGEFKIALTPLVILVFIGWFFSLKIREKTIL